MQSAEHYMQLALDLAKQAYDMGEVPVGAVVVDANGAVIGRGHNLRESQKNALLHAEIIAIEEACKYQNDWRLSDATLYVTLEPCPMCAGAILNARIGQVVYGAKDNAMGAMGSVCNLFYENFGFSPRVQSGVLADKSRVLMQEFFKALR